MKTYLGNCSRHANDTVLMLKTFIFCFKQYNSYWHTTMTRMYHLKQKSN